MKHLASICQLSPTQLRQVDGYLPGPEPAMRGTRHIPVCEPVVGAKEKKYVESAMSSSWISSAGDFVGKFQTAFAKHISKTRYAFAVNSGTSALHVALSALGIRTGDEVIVPTFTMVATVNAIMYCGATPVFIDADPVTWNIDTTHIKQRISKKTKAILVVHTYGAPAAMNEVCAIAKRHNLWVIEDAAEAHGAQYKGRAVGSIGDVAAFSMYANKTITTGEGGVAVTNNPGIAKRIELLLNHAFSPERHFWHTMIGFGYRMTNLQAAVGLAQVERFGDMLAKKRAHAAIYTSLLSKIPGLTLPTEEPGMLHSYWMYGVLVDKKTYGMDKNALRELLAAHGIETRSFFIPIHIQPAYFRQFGRQTYPVSMKLCRDGLYLPSSAKLTTTDITRISTYIRDAAKSA